MERRVKLSDEDVDALVSALEDAIGTADDTLGFLENGKHKDQESCDTQRAYAARFRRLHAMFAAINASK